MRSLQGLLFLALGIGLMLVAYRSLSRGWLPFGSRGFLKRLEVDRNEQPLFFWLAFGMYAAAGVALVVFAVRLLAGHADPLPLR